MFQEQAVAAKSKVGMCLSMSFIRVHITRSQSYPVMFVRFGRHRHPTSSNVNGLPNGLPPRSSICGSTEYTEGAKGWSASGHHLNTPVRNEAWYWRWSWMKPAKKVPKEVEATEKAKELRPRNCRSIDCRFKKWHHCALHLQLPEALPHSGSAFNADTHHSEKVRAPQPLLLTQKRLFCVKIWEATLEMK